MWTCAWGSLLHWGQHHTQPSAAFSSQQPAHPKPRAAHTAAGFVLMAGNAMATCRGQHCTPLWGILYALHAVHRAVEGPRMGHSLPSQCSALSSGCCEIPHHPAASLGSGRGCEQDWIFCNIVLHPQGVANPLALSHYGPLSPHCSQRQPKPTLGPMLSVQVQLVACPTVARPVSICAGENPRQCHKQGHVPGRRSCGSGAARGWRACAA
jgi:hypothetical protein